MLIFFEATKWYTVKMFFAFCVVDLPFAMDCKRQNLYSSSTASTERNSVSQTTAEPVSREPPEIVVSKYSEYL